MELTSTELFCLGPILEGFLFGLYSAIFGMYLQYTRQKVTDGNNTAQNITFYAICVLYVLTTVVLGINIANVVVMNVLSEFNNDLSMLDRLGNCQNAVFACCDFIAQSILIYRCWIVWNRNTRIVIIPSILAFAYLVMWIASIGSPFATSGRINQTGWGFKLGLTSLAASITVNALVTGLIVLRILKVFYQLKLNTTSHGESGITGGSKLRSISFVMIESAMILFAIQLTRLTMGIIPLRLNTTNDLLAISYIITCIHTMLNGITPTIILVRVAMGFSFHDEPSLVESVSNVQFNANPTHGMGSIDSVNDAGSFMGPDDTNSNYRLIGNNSEERRLGEEDISRENDDIHNPDRAR